MPLLNYSAELAAIPGARIVGRKILIPPVSMRRKAANLARAFGEVVSTVAGGRKVFASEETIVARRATCWVCDLWRPGGNLGFGECTHPGCGCTRAKLKLASSRCPLRRWPA